MHLTDAVTIESIGPVDISTIDLSINGFGSGYETCLFWGQDSEVVGWYAKESDARRYHKEWLSPARVVEAIHHATASRNNPQHYDED